MQKKAERRGEARRGERSQREKRKGILLHWMNGTKLLWLSVFRARVRVAVKVKRDSV
jgi:hypothetical protein